MLIVRSLAYNFVFYVSLIVLMIIGLPVVLWGRRGVFALARLWGAWSMLTAKWICGLNVEYRGLRNIPSGGYILASKHQSFLETFALLKHTPDFAIILKRQLNYIPFFGMYLMVSQQIGIDRAKGHSALAQIIEEAGKVLSDGRQVYIYPEGTRRSPGARPAYKIGVAALYEASGAPCVPVALNTGLFWGRRGFLRRPGVAVIEFLPVIPPGLDRQTFGVKLQDAIESGCARLNAEALSERPYLATLLSADA